MIKITIKRYHQELYNAGKDSIFEVDEKLTLLQNLYNIKSKQDPTLSYSSGCQSGVCGSCAVRVNQKEILACKYKPKDGDYVEALRFFEPIVDLIVKSNSYEMINKTASYIKNPQTTTTNSYFIQSDCILCGSCHSACPVYETNQNFISPYIYSKLQKISKEQKDGSFIDKLETIQDNGIWDCVSCMACSVVCPQGLDPKNDVDMLKNISVSNGYSIKTAMPSYDNFGGFNPSFGGFNP